MKVEQWRIGDIDSTAVLVQIGMNELYRRVIGHGIRDFASLGERQMEIYLEMVFVKTGKGFRLL